VADRDRTQSQSTSGGNRTTKRVPAAFRRKKRTASLFDMTGDVTRRVDFSGRSNGSTPEVARLIEEIRALTLELKELERRATPDARLLELRRGLEQLRWQLAEAARHAASGTERPVA
jgi:hypothetical protein